jgi:acyl-CoA thioester hydrolase
MSTRPDDADVTDDLNAYGFRTEVRVRLSETDAVGIVFFGSFATYLDVGRMDYLQNLDLQAMHGAVRDLIPGAVVAQSIRYLRPARYNDELVIHVRVAHIGHTSYTFHFLFAHKRTREKVATGRLTLVWMDDAFRPMRVPDAFRETVRAFEGPLLTEA